MFPQQSAVFFFQETHYLNAIVTTRSTYDESCKNLSLMDLSPKNASAPSYVSHRLSPTLPRKTKSRKKSPD